MISYLRNKSRDNARTPMQWDETDEAGFTTGVPWMPVNPNYKRINAAAQIGDEDSVYNYYRKLISLRKEYPIIVMVILNLWERIMLMSSHTCVIGRIRYYGWHAILQIGCRRS